MKKVFLSLCILFTVVSVSGQGSIESIFRKYSGNSDYVSISLNGGLAKLLSVNDEDGMLKSISDVRIIALKDGCDGNDSFYKEIMNQIDGSKYEELLRVNESDQDVIILVRNDKNVYKEVLIVVGGDDNALIQLKGNLSQKEAEKIASNINISLN